MKNMILVVSITLGMLLHVNAQNNNHADNQFKFGLKAGLNVANATGNGVNLFTGNKSSSSRLGLILGALIEYEISDKFSIQPELHYSRQGFKTGVNEGVVKLDYINIPVLAKYYISEGFSLEVGPQVGFLLSSKYNRQEQQLAARRDAVTKAQINLNNEDLKEYFSSTDFGLNIGLSYQMNNGIGVNTRYNLGLKDIFDYSKTVTSTPAAVKTKVKKASSNSDYVIKNRVFQVGVFYTF